MAAPAVVAGQIPGYIYDTATQQWYQIIGAPGITGPAGRGIMTFDQPTEPLTALPGDVWFVP